MKILAIDTASEICSVAILEDTHIIKEISIETANTHSVKLMPAISQLFCETGYSLNDLELLACDKGPGSFTGIRIGISTIKAFYDTTNIPCIGISSLEALAYGIQNYQGYICSLIDAKNDQVYYSLYEHTNQHYEQIGQYLADSITNITEILKNCNKPIYFVGNGSILHQDMLQSSLKENALFPIDQNVHKLSAVSIGKAAFANYLTGNFSPLSPLYLRKSSAERIQEEKENGTAN